MKTTQRLIISFVCLCFFFVTTSNLFASSLWGTKDNQVSIPQEGRLEDVSKPDHIIGTGTPESCTAEAFINAVAKGGTIVFNGGNKPFTITLTKPAKIFNNGKPDVVIDGGGVVTLSGGNTTRILYMNTADPNQVWTTDHAQNQDHPRLTIQNLTFANGNATKEKEYTGGGAVWVRGGRFKVVNCRFINNTCASTGPDMGGGAIRVFDQYEDLPVYVVNSTFGGGENLGNSGSNGGAISSIGVSWTIINSEFSYNKALGNGGNPQKPGTPGGGSGGAIYNDGNEMRLTITNSLIEKNQVNAYGSGVFFVTNNHTGDIVLNQTTLANNVGGSWYPVHPNVSSHSDTPIRISSGLLPEPVQLIAIPTKAAVFVNGRALNFEAYTIHGNNYFKLRDLAFALNQSNKPFEVTWDTQLAAIKMKSLSPYTPVGGEMKVKAILAPVMSKLNNPTMVLDDSPVLFKAYNIGGYNYFKLRDIGRLLDFGIAWNSEKGQIEIDTSKGYVE